MIIKINVLFIIEDAPSTYRAILDWNTINPYKIVASTVHKMNFLTRPTPSTHTGVGDITSDQIASRKLRELLAKEKSQGN